MESANDALFLNITCLSFLPLAACVFAASIIITLKSIYVLL